MTTDPRTDQLLENQERYLVTLEQLLAMPALDVPATLQQVCQLLISPLRADKIDMFVYDPARTTLTALGTSDTPLGRRQQNLGLDQLALANGGRTVEVFQTGTPYYTNHLDQDLDEVSGIREGLDIHSMLVVPVTVEHIRRGVLSVATVRADAFTPADQQFLQAVAHWVGLAWHRAELVEHQTQTATAEVRRRSAEEIITVLAHDLRNRLSPILGRSALLQERAVREKRAQEAEQLATLTKGIQNLGQLITNLLDVGRLQQGLFHLTIQPVNLVTLAHDAATLLQRADAPIQVQAPSEAIAEVDPDRIRQALENLLANAQRYTPSGVPVELIVQTLTQNDTSWVALSVRDTGPGIPPNRLPSLFQRFATGRESKGLGLGLYLAHSIAEAHGGTLTVETQEGMGATFTFMVPMEGPGQTT